MGGRAKFPLAALALGAGVAMATSVSAAGDGSGPTAADSPRAAASKGVLVTAQRTQRPIRAMVSVNQPTRRRRGRLFASLHGVTPGARYRVDGNKAECSADGDVDGADFLVWRSFVRSTKSSDDVGGTARVPLNTSLRRTKSVRIYALPSGGSPVQSACLSVDVWEHA